MYPLTLNECASFERERYNLERNCYFMEVERVAPVAELLSMPSPSYSNLVAQPKQSLTEQCILHIEMMETSCYLLMPSLQRYALLLFRRTLNTFTVRGDGDNIMQMVEECVEVLKDMIEPVRWAIGDALRSRSLL